MLPQLAASPTMCTLLLQAKLYMDNVSGLNESELLVNIGVVSADIALAVPRFVRCQRVISRRPRWSEDVRDLDAGDTRPRISLQVLR